MYSNKFNILSTDTTNIENSIISSTTTISSEDVINEYIENDLEISSIENDMDNTIVPNTNLTINIDTSNNTTNVYNIITTTTSTNNDTLRILDDSSPNY